MYKQGDLCPICGAGTIKVERKKESFEYKGQVLTLELTVYSCNVCGESFYDNEEMRKHQKTIKDFQRRVDGLLTSDEIRQIREKYGLSQRELARILGIAEKSIAKYEAGFVSQSKAMDNLLRVIERFPDVLSYLMLLNQMRERGYQEKVVLLEDLGEFEQEYEIKDMKDIYRQEEDECNEFEIQIA